MRAKHILLIIGTVISLALISGGAYAQDDESYEEEAPATAAPRPKRVVKKDTVPLPPMGVYKRENIPEKLRPVPYPYIREADVLWSKIIWRVIDLRQKMNFPLYYPTTQMRDRQSLAQALYNAIKEGKISAYDPAPSVTSPGDEFVQRISISEVKANLGMDMDMVDTTYIEGPDGSRTMEVKDGDIPWHEIKQIWLKEEWFFDTKHSVLQVRVLGICPVRFYYDETNYGTDDESGEAEAPPKEAKLKLAFWVYYPEAREVLSQVAYYNPKNDAQVSSYDDLFFKRRFGSYISRESNAYNNRAVYDYKSEGVQQMRESQRIYYDIFNKEHDLWEY